MPFKLLVSSDLAPFEAFVDEKISEALAWVVNAPTWPLPVMNNTFLLFFFDMLLPYAFHLTYLNMSLPTGIQKLPNTCLTCVCLTVNTPLPYIYHMFNMLFMHVHVTFCYYLNW
jgi:hypothetical protein